MNRSLEWAGCVNVRDLGGVPIEGGGDLAYDDGFHRYCPADDAVGLIAAVLLRLAGVSIEDAAVDDALSGDNLRRTLQAGLDDPTGRRRLFQATTPAEAMARTLRTLGDAEGFLRGAGVSARRVARLRDRLAAA